MVIESGFKPLSGVEEGADAILHIATSPGLGWRTGLITCPVKNATTRAKVILPTPVSVAPDTVDDAMRLRQSSVERFAIQAQ
jgi:hypothetical protein